MSKINIGSRLKTLRQEKGLSLRQLARRAGCSASFISQLELNRSSPSINNFSKICEALQMPMIDVLREITILPEEETALHSEK